MALLTRVPLLAQGPTSQHPSPRSRCRLMLDSAARTCARCPLPSYRIALRLAQGSREALPACSLSIASMRPRSPGALEFVDSRILPRLSNGRSQHHRQGMTLEQGTMKRIKVAPGKFVIVSQALADKAERVFASGAFTREQVRAAEPPRASLVMLGRRSPARRKG